MTILSHIGAIAALLGLFVFYRWRTRVPKEVSDEKLDVLEDLYEATLDEPLEDDYTVPDQIEAERILARFPGSVQDFLRFFWDTLESINDATSPAELEACQQEIDFIADTFKGLIESGYLEQHVTWLDLALAMRRSRIQKKAT
jgi:hypothetical protein